MNKDEKLQLAVFIRQVTLNFPEADVEEAVELCSLARKMHRLNKHESNRELSRREQSMARNIANRAYSIAAKWGTSLKIDSDPRGYAFKIQLPNQRYNTWGGPETGWGVPEV